MTSMFAPVRNRFRAWWMARAPRSDTQLLTQSNIYIVPTRAGFMFGATLIALGLQIVLSSFFVSILGMRRR